MKPLHLVNYLKTLSWRKYRPEIKRYLILLLIPVFLMVLLYINVNQVVTHQAEDYAQLIVDHFRVQSTSMLHEMHLVSNAILRDSNVSHLLESDGSNSFDYLHICDILKDSLQESSYVQHAYLICEKSGDIFSDTGLFGSNSLQNILQKIGTDYSELLNISEEADFHVLNENRLAPYCIVPIRDASGNPLGTLIVTLRMTEFLRIFHSLDAELCTIFNEDVYISSYIRNIGPDNFDWRSQLEISKLLGKPVTCVYAEQGDYTYLVAVSKENYARPLHVIIQWFFIYALAVLVLGYLYLYQISKRRWQHITNMIEALPLSYTGDHSYEHIYENIRKSLEEYRTKQEDLRVEDTEHTLHMLLRSEKDQKITAEQFQNVGIDPNSKVYYVCSYFITEAFDHASKEEKAHTESFIHVLFRSTIKELSEQFRISCAVCSTRKTGIAVLFGNDAAALKEAVPVFSKNVVEILTGSFNTSMQATISSPVTSVLMLPDAFQETTRIRSFAKSINSNAVIISQEDMQHSGSALLSGDFIRQEQILINTILVRKYDVVPSMVESILSTHVTPLRKDYALGQSRLMSISNVLAEGVRIASIPGLSEAENARAIRQADSVRQLVSVTERIYGQMAAQSQSASSETDAVSLAIDYIRQNLSDQNLNVTAICEAAGVSVQRLTRMFQAQFNMAIAEYMNTCRIKQAKELLPNKQLTVSQIAQLVGYSNADTFTRNFKKVEGVTASEYRKTLSEE